MRPLVRLLVTAVIAGAGLAVGLGLLVPQVRELGKAGRPGKPEEVAQIGEMAQNSFVYGRDGSLLAVLHAEENRTPVSLDRVPRHLIDAVLDVEDDHFWEHRGVNLRSTVRALVTNVQSGEIRQGGSTITQQLVKNSLLTPEKSVDRKVKEAVLAVRLEKRLSKREILERYLNAVYFGNGAYGVQAAAQTYFNTDVSRLTKGQAALLAGIMRNPVGYDPFKSPDVARARRDLALERMADRGHLDRREADLLRSEPLPAKAFVLPPAPSDYFVEEVKQRLLADERLGETPQERYNAVFKGGLKIYTTLDPRMQRLAEARRAEILPTSLTNGQFTSALVSVEPATGYVRAMVAGDDFGRAKYNLATQGMRQPGSSFKPYVLLAAIEAGYGPGDVVDGTSPCTLKLPGSPPYTPGNYEGSSGGWMSLTEATAKSVNCAYARLGVDVGLNRVVDVAARLGIPRERLKPYASISLGSQEATPLEMASAYATIANDGVYHAPRFLEKVVDRRGRVVLEGADKGKRVMAPQVARVAISVMQAVVERGTGTKAALPGRQVAGKTGTSQEHENAWFVGFTPQLTTAVWMGAPVGNVPMKSVGGIRVTGGSYPARIWGAYMQGALEGLPPVPFHPAGPVPKARVRIPGGEDDARRFLRDRRSGRDRRSVDDWRFSDERRSGRQRDGDGRDGVMGGGQRRDGNGRDGERQSDRGSGR